MKLALSFALRLSELNYLQTNLASMVQQNIKITENLTDWSKYLASKTKVPQLVFSVLIILRIVHIENIWYSIF